MVTDNRSIDAGEITVSEPQWVTEQLYETSYVSVSLSPKARQALREAKQYLGVDTLSDAIMQMWVRALGERHRGYMLRFFRDGVKWGAHLKGFPEYEARLVARSWAAHYGVLVQGRLEGGGGGDYETFAKPRTGVSGLSSSSPDVIDPEPQSLEAGMFYPQVEYNNWRRDKVLYPDHYTSSNK